MQILVANGHPPDAVETYPLCRIEAFVESITHLENIQDRKTIVHSFISAQGDSKSVKNCIKDIKLKKGNEEGDDVDSFLGAFRAGFKGLD